MFGFFRAILGICETRPLTSGWEVINGGVVVNSEGLAGIDSLGGAAYIQGIGLEKPVLIIKMGKGDYLAFENKCTHGGRKLDPKADGSGLRCCSVNHSTYDLEGKNLTGPAKSPVAKYDTAFENGELRLTLAS